MRQKNQKIKAWKYFKLGRNTGVRGNPKERILIICEGEKTEPNYFRSFKVSSATVIVKGLGQNTTTLVQSAIILQQKALAKEQAFDKIWCVFDRDSFTPEDFNNALVLGKKNNIEIAYSNEAFEIWYLLHFAYFHVPLSRGTYKQKLTKYLGKEYKKNSETMYDDLFPHQTQAIKHAKKLLNSYKDHNPEKDNPSTTVFRLVEELNKNL